MFKKLIGGLPNTRHDIRYVSGSWRNVEISIKELDGKPVEFYFQNEETDDIEVIHYEVIEPNSEWSVRFKAGEDYDGYIPEHNMLLFGTVLSAEQLIAMCIDALEASVQP